MVEKWVLHKLNFAAGKVNEYMADRDFMNTTNTIYNFWLYELCDVYIVRSTSYSILFRLLMPE